MKQVHVRGPDGRTVPIAGRPCAYCMRPMTRKRGGPGVKMVLPPDHATKDHVIPKSKGGAPLPNNKVWACACCNTLKGNMMPEEWDAWMAAHPRWWEGDYRQPQALDLQHEDRGCQT